LENKFTVKLSVLIDELKLTKVYAPEEAGENCEKVLISSLEINRPGLQLTGYYNYFENNRIQIIGKVEMTFLEDIGPEERAKHLDMLFSKSIPVLIISRDLPFFSEIMDCAIKYKTPVYKSYESTSSLMATLISALNLHLAPRITTHGVLVEVYGEGILMIGESGVGKSETAMELMKRGHRLVADDAVEIKRVSSKTLVGSSPENIRHLMELRGIGIVDVRRIFGMGAVKEIEKIDLVIQLEDWEENKFYDRLGMETTYYNILGQDKPSFTIPIKPGRNLAIIIEVAAMNNRQKKLGYNAAFELNKRLMADMGWKEQD